MVGRRLVECRELQLCRRARVWYNGLELRMKRILAGLCRGGALRPLSFCFSLFQRFPFQPV